MFLIDNIVTAPLRGVVWLAEKVHTAAVDENEQEAEVVIQQLTELYRLLETEQISEAEFDQQEQQLLDQLEQYEDSSV
jgi:predicted Zn-dependent peptidase